MSKDRNYIIILGGIFVIIGIIVFGVVKHFIYPADDADFQKQIIDFLLFTIVSSIGTALTMASILNLAEKKELKEVTKLNNEYSVTIIKQQNTFITQLSDIAEGIAKINENENERNRLLLIKDSEHEKEHEDLDKRVESIENKLDLHIENHN